MLVIDCIERHALGVQQGQEVALHVHEDALEGLGGVNAIDDRDEALLVG